MLTAYTHFGKNHLHFDVLDSTNTFAQNLIAKSSPMDGTVISAGFQSQGRGQFDRKWLSNPGENLCFSIIVYPHFLQPNQQFYLSMCVATAIAKVLENEKMGNVKLKWPNDLYIGPLKTGGILIVNQLQGLKWASSVIGIGINVNQTSFDPALPNPTSLAIHTSTVLNLKHLLDNILFQIEHDYNHYLKTVEFETISAEYHKYLLGYEQAVTYSSRDTIRQGVLKGVMPDGRIWLEGEWGKELFANGETSLTY